MYSRILYREISQMRGHPKLDEALENYVENYLNFSMRGHNISKLASEDIKYLLALKITELCTDPVASRYFTKAQLQAFAREHAIATQNRVSAIIDMAVRSGYLTVEQSPHDRRQNPLVPTARFFRCLTASATLYSSSLTILFGVQYSEIQHAMASISRHATDIYFECMVFRQRNTTARLFIKRDGGYEVLMKLLQASQLFSCCPYRVVNLPFSKLSRSLGVSRAHIQKLFRAAEEAGLIVVKTAGGKEIEILPRLDKVARDMIIIALAIAKVAVDRSFTDLDAKIHAHDISIPAQMLECST